MSEHNELGKLGEKLAAEHLREKGYTIIKQNYVFGKSEVDIVAQINNQLVFVEVKTRQSAYLSDPEYTISMKKQRQVIKAADAYVKENDLDMESRFDVITVIVNSQYKKVDHIEDAFYPVV
jgi:putative endonuclease